MKRLFVIGALILGLSGLLEAENYGYRQVFITNASQYPNYKIISYVPSPPGGFDTSKLIEDNVELDLSSSRSYAYSYLFVMTSELFDAYGGLGGIDLGMLFELSQQHEQELRSPFPEFQAVFDDNCSVKIDTYYYRIESINDANITFKLQKRILTDSEGATQTITY